MRREKLGRDCVADVEKLCYPSIPSADVHTLRIGKKQPDQCSSDEEEEEYISLDTPIEAIVSAARSNQVKSTEALGKEPIKKILSKRIQKED